MKISDTPVPASPSYLFTPDEIAQELLAAAVHEATVGCQVNAPVHGAAAWWLHHSSLALTVRPELGGQQASLFTDGLHLYVPVAVVESALSSAASHARQQLLAQTDTSSSKQRETLLGDRATRAALADRLLGFAREALTLSADLPVAQQWGDKWCGPVAMKDRILTAFANDAELSKNKTVQRVLDYLGLPPDEAQAETYLYQKNAWAIDKGSHAAEPAFDALLNPFKEAALALGRTGEMDERWASAHDMGYFEPRLRVCIEAHAAAVEWSVPALMGRVAAGQLSFHDLGQQLGMMAKQLGWEKDQIEEIMMAVVAVSAWSTPSADEQYLRQKYESHAYESFLRSGMTQADKEEVGQGFMKNLEITKDQRDGLVSGLSLVGDDAFREYMGRFFKTPPRVDVHHQEWLSSQSQPAMKNASSIQRPKI